jgi:hypothetical protein
MDPQLPLGGMDIALSLGYSGLLLAFLIGSYWWLARVRPRK